MRGVSIVEVVPSAAANGAKGKKTKRAPDEKEGDDDEGGEDATVVTVSKILEDIKQQQQMAAEAGSGSAAGASGGSSSKGNGGGGSSMKRTATIFFTECEIEEEEEEKEEGKDSSTGSTSVLLQHITQAGEGTQNKDSNGRAFEASSPPILQAVLIPSKIDSFKETAEAGGGRCDAKSVTSLSAAVGEGGDATMSGHISFAGSGAGDDDVSDIV